MWLNEAPDPANLREWANKYPDRWATAISQIAKVAGFSERREVANFNFNVADLSDSQLEDQMIALADYMNIPPTQLMEAVTAVMLEGSTPGASAPEPPQAAREPSAVQDAVFVDISTDVEVDDKASDHKNNIS